MRVLHDDSQKMKITANSGVHKKHLKGVIKGRLPKWLRTLLETAGEKADEMGINAYLVGGFVRDLAYCRENFDVDIVVEGGGIAYAEALAKLFEGRIRSHKKFGTAVVVLPDGFKIDVASARMEYYKTPAALPTVEASSIKMDLQRRDFTINAMAIRINSRGFGELTDYFGGLRDIKEKAIRVLHSLSFIEDPTRAFRAVRFEQRIGFHIGKQSLKLIKNAAKLNFFDKVSPSRIFNELKIILTEPEPLWALKRMTELDIMRFIHPKFTADQDFEFLFQELHKVLDWYELLFKEEKYVRWLLYFAALQSPLSEEEVTEMSQKIGLATKESEKIIEIKKVSKKIISALSKEAIDDCTLFHHLEKLKIETLLFMMAAANNVRVKERISRYITDLKEVRIETTGHDLKELGLKPGTLYNNIKRALIDEKLRGRLKSKEEELAFIKARWLDAK
jgi:tRNA nucleotidyltransferase (CCA-adding enzyme)